MRQELEGGGMTMVMAFDGTTAWGLNPNLGPAPAALTGENAAMIREQADLDGPLVDYEKKGNTIEYLGSETVAGRRMHQLRVTSPTQRVTRCYLDAETGLEARLVTQTPRGEMVQELSDYRDVEGLKFPFKVTTSIGGVPAVAIQITRVEINPQIDDAIFKMGGGR
jgi:outer membrane lipoprotein-sorting protein